MNQFVTDHRLSLFASDMVLSAVRFYPWPEESSKIMV